MRYVWEFRVPLFGWDRRVRAWALVDEGDFWALNGFRWCLTTSGYAGRTEPGRRGSALLMHRDICRLERGDGLVVDHINRVRLDNRRVNLRVVGTLENLQNMPSLSDATSRFRGVSWNSRAGKWVAQCKTNGRTHYLGVFVVEEEAAAVARAFRLANLPGAVD